jgi:lysozyme
MIKIMLTPEFVKMLKADEGYRKYSYHDTLGNLTVGYGRAIDIVGVSEEEASFLLQNDINKAEEDLIRFMPCYKNLDSIRQQTLCMMAFNMGIYHLLQFKGMIAALEVKNYPEAAKEMLASLWAKQVGLRAHRLANLMESGELLQKGY